MKKKSTNLETLVIRLEANTADFEKKMSAVMTRCNSQLLALENRMRLLHKNLAKAGIHMPKVVAKKSKNRKAK